MVNTMSTLPNKYQYLEIAKQAGINTPPTWLVQNLPNVEDIQQFTQNIPSTYYIVRSAINLEDGGIHSLAGHFWSSDKVLADELEHTIKQGFIENTKLLNQHTNEGIPHLMVQPFIEHTIGGVAFCPWSFFSEYSYVEYSNTVQNVVAGNAHYALMSLKPEYSPPIPLQENSLWITSLQHTISILKNTFNFPLDIEWAFNSETSTFTLLQIRPQTYLVGTLKTATELPTLPHGNWQYGALSESLGRLSPLSFAFLKYLYNEARTTLQLIGYKAQAIDFICRLPDGTILVDPEKEQQFYKTTLMGGFWRGFKAPIIQNQIADEIKIGIGSSIFDIKRLSLLFSLWLASNSLSQGAGRDEVLDPQRYELTWLNPPPTFEPKISKDWPVLSTQIRDLFFNEWHKLKLILKQHPEAAFCTLEDFQANQFNQINRQHEQVLEALYNYLPLLNNSTSTLQSLSIAKVVIGTIFRIDNPATFRGEIPKNVILVTPYFDNRWVHQIKDLKGIIVERGSRLAHSTLVAREEQVPYVIHSNLSTLLMGQVIILDTIKSTIELQT
jgi:phosphohistidine swiveling domain-containing protein